MEDNRELVIKIEEISKLAEIKQKTFDEWSNNRGKIKEECLSYLKEKKAIIPINHIAEIISKKYQPTNIYSACILLASEGKIMRMEKPKVCYIHKDYFDLPFEELSTEFHHLFEPKKKPKKVLEMKPKKELKKKPKKENKFNPSSIKLYQQTSIDIEVAIIEILKNNPEVTSFYQGLLNTHLKKYFPHEEITKALSRLCTKGKLRRSLGFRNNSKFTPIRSKF